MLVIYHSAVGTETALIFFLQATYGPKVQRLSVDFIGSVPVKGSSLRQNITEGSPLKNGRWKFVPTAVLIIVSNMHMQLTKLMSTDNIGENSASRLLYLVWMASKSWNFFLVFASSRLLSLGLVSQCV